VGSEDGVDYLVMEYLDGEILQDRHRRRVAGRTDDRHRRDAGGN
jgi:hypothetical protein